MRKLVFGRLDSERPYVIGRGVKAYSIVVGGASQNLDQGYDTSQVPCMWGTDGFRIVGILSFDLASVRRRIGAQPLIISAKLRLYYRQVETSNPFTSGVAVFRGLKSVNMAVATGRYRDTSVPWTNDAYLPFPGEDLESSPMDKVVFQSTTPLGWYSWEVGKAVAFGLIANSPVYLFLSPPVFGEKAPGAANQTAYFERNSVDRVPYLELSYLFAIEFFGATQAGTLDLSSNIGGTPGDPAQSLYLGAVERGTATTPKKVFLVNFSGRTIPVLGVWDNWPEWTDPVKTAGTGTGVFAYPALFKNAVSQKWQIRFTSPTDYEVRATAFRDYATDLHSTWGGAGWVGNTAADWTAPSGGVQIPAAAFSGTFAAGDTFEFYVKGNTTDTTWPSDSAAQVFLAKDNGGTPDTTWWRAEGNKTTLAAQTTIDAATKVLTVRRITPSQWQVGDPVLITDGTNSDYGTITALTETTITVGGLTVTNHVFGIGTFVATCLCFTNIEPSVTGISTAAAGASQSLPYRVYLTDPMRSGLTPSGIGFTNGMTVTLQDGNDPTITETGIIAAIGPNYIDLTANLSNDFVANSLIIGGTGGTRAFWVKAVASATTTEELKLLRLDAWTQ